jgi:hypothetical protein
MTYLVILRPFRLVFQHFIGFDEFFELCFCIIMGTNIGVILSRYLSISRLYSVIIRIRINIQNFVVVFAVYNVSRPGDLNK